MSLRKFFATFMIASVLLATQCSKESAVPDELIGVWETAYPGYEDRGIEITKNTLIFERGGGYFDFATYPIVGIDKAFEDRDILYVIYYVNPEGYRYEFSIYYNPTDGGTFRFRDREQIKWTKRKKKSNLGASPPLE
jgi:hypothetical protein